MKCAANSSGPTSRRIPDERRIEPRERAHQLLQLARRLQLVLASQRAQHAMTHTPVLIAIGLHQAQIHVALLRPAPRRDA